jgi:RHS repeat-associated protein
VPQPFLYASYIYDRELSGPGESSGWYWLSVRHYDPVLERFVQPDPSQQEGTRSYVYAGDDPLDASDPSGLILCGKHFFGLINNDCSHGAPPSPNVEQVAQFVSGVGLTVLGGVVAVGSVGFGPESGGTSLGGLAWAGQLEATGIALAGVGLSYAGSQVATHVFSSASGGGAPQQLRLFDDPLGAEPVVDATSIGEQIPPVSDDLSEMAASIRAGTGTSANRDLAVAEYQAEDGSFHYEYAFSRSGVHAEEVLWTKLQAAVVRGDQVTRLYSELEPCGPALANCRTRIPTWFPNARVSWSFRYPDDRLLRETGPWRAHIRAITGG